MFGSPSTDKKAYVVVYDGYGTPSSFTVGGRVLEDKGEKAPVKAASGLDNLVDTFKQLESDEVRNAEVHVDVAGRVFTATTDEDGMFRVFVKDLPAKERLPAGAHVVKVTSQEPIRAEGAGVVTIADGAFIGLVSDIDDTVVKTYVTDKKKMLGTVFLKNAKQLDPVEGAATNYQKARDAGVKMFFYVSGSPQNFYRRLHAYLETHEFPLGPIVLKNIGDDMLKQIEYKVDRISSLLKAMPQMKIVCVGDSGEKDPEVYAEIKKRFPDRVVATVIRTVSGSDVRPTRFTGMTIVDDKYAGDDVIARLLTPPAAPASTATAPTAPTEAAATTTTSVTPTLPATKPPP